MTTRVIVVDDQDLVRSGFRMIVEADPGLTVVGEAANGLEAVDLAHREWPDVILMDVRMPELDGIEATRRILGPSATGTLRPEDRPLPKILILTTFDLDAYVFEGLRAGASGFLLKDVRPDELVHAVHVVAAGEALLSPTATRRVIEAFVGGDDLLPIDDAALAELTPREREVLAMIGRGLTNAEIAQHLFLSMATVKTHVNRIFAKLALRDRAQAVVVAYETGLVRAGDPA